MVMGDSQNFRNEARLVGQQLGSVLITIDSITLNFAKYPLTLAGKFTDSVLVDIDEGFEIIENSNHSIIRKDDDLVRFRSGGADLIKLISFFITDAKYLSNGELELEFNNRIVLRLLLNAYGFDSFDLTFQAK
jgi:hypothetical protein